MHHLAVVVVDGPGREPLERLLQRDAALEPRRARHRDRSGCRSRTRRDDSCRARRRSNRGRPTSARRGRRSRSAARPSCSRAASTRRSRPRASPTDPGSPTAPPNAGSPRPRSGSAAAFAASLARWSGKRSRPTADHPRNRATVSLPAPEMQAHERVDLVVGEVPGGPVGLVELGRHELAHDVVAGRPPPIVDDAPASSRGSRAAAPTSSSPSSSPGSMCSISSDHSRSCGFVLFRRAEQRGDDHDRQAGRRSRRRSRTSPDPTKSSRNPAASARIRGSSADMCRGVNARLTSLR